MKSIYKFLIIAFITPSSMLFAQQIPNGGFEEWTPTPFWTNNPAEWTTDNTEISAPVYPDSASYSGALAMTLVPDANGIGVGDAVAEVEVDIQYIPSLLTFYSKWDFVVGQGGLTVTFYNGEAVVLTETWTPDQTQPNSDWQFIQMSLPQIEPIITHAVIRCWAQVGDLASASISFDEMEWDVVNGLNELAEDSFSLSPNPCNNHLNIVTKEAFDPNMTITIYDALGREVYFGSNTNQLSVQSLNNGQYFLRMTSDSKLITKRFMVKR